MDRIGGAASRGLTLLSAIGLILMTLIVGWQVFGRYVLNQSPDWSEQAALALMIWYICGLNLTRRNIFNRSCDGCFWVTAGYANMVTRRANTGCYTRHGISRDTHWRVFNRII